ncbi:MAG: ferrous iron transport protein A [Clostridiales bacterium]|nr:ferrous iron transport protein A [Clostridiales bacterium]
MNLTDCAKGSDFIVEKSMLKQPGKRRLEAMGLIEGTRIRKINEAIDGSIIINIRGTRLAIGKDLGSDIIVRNVTASDIGRNGKRHGAYMGIGHGKGRGMGRRRGNI